MAIIIRRKIRPIFAVFITITVYIPDWLRFHQGFVNSHFPANFAGHREIVGNETWEMGREKWEIGRHLGNLRVYFPLIFLISQFPTHLVI